MHIKTKTKTSVKKNHTCVHVDAVSAVKNKNATMDASDKNNDAEEVEEMEEEAVNDELVDDDSDMEDEEEEERMTMKLKMMMMEK